MTDDLVARRLTSQLLSGPKTATPEAVVERILAVQAQDARGARLAIRARSKHLTAVDVDRALTDTRSLVITWLNRCTLHLVTGADYWWLHALTAPRIATMNERRLRQEGVTERQAARGVDLIIDTVTKRGPQTREQLKRALDRAKIPTDGQALVHLLLAASFRRDLVRGPMIGKDHAFTSAEAWLGPPPPSLDRNEALARLGARYLAGHAPAEPADLATWAGLPLTDARRAFELAEATQPRAKKPRPLPRPILLGPFDPILHGWKSRAPFVGAYGNIVTRNGVFRPIALVDGKAVATWSLNAGAITIRPFEELDKATLDALDRDGDDVRRFLGLPA